MNIPDGVRYTKEHEWVQMDDSNKTATVGITDFAQESLGDVTFIELPKEGDSVKSNEAFGVVESVKAVSDLYAPATGKVVEVNQTLTETPELVNEDPYHEAWMIRISVEEIDESTLMDAAQYKKFVEESQ